MSCGAEDLHNDGLMVLNAGAARAGPPTFIVSGVARSGTSMVARALSEAGVFMGSDLDAVVFEDGEIATALESPISLALAGVVSARNATGRPWGFKRPHLFAHGSPGIVNAFRNPHVVLTFRDPVAIAMRNSISEHFELAPTLRGAAADLQRCTEFALGLTCPALLVSYEKSLQRPEAFIDRLIGFCGLDVTPGARARMALSVEGGRPEYLDQARRRYEGYLDRVEGGVAHGWCRQVGLREPLMLEVSVGGDEPTAVWADLPRDDLAVAMDFVCHGFAIDISDRIVGDQDAVTVRVQNRVFELTGSGLTVDELRRRP